MSKWKPPQTKDAQAITWFYGDIPFNDGKPDTSAEAAAMLVGYRAAQVQSAEDALRYQLERATIMWQSEQRRARHWWRRAIEAEKLVLELEAALDRAQPPATINLWDRLRRLFK